MSTIAVITLTKNPNYGNVLQNIAMQRSLCKFGYNVETIKNMHETSLFVGKNGIKNKLKIWLNWNGAKTEETRRRRFLECCNRYIKYSTSFVYDGNKICGDIDRYDYFIAGSDQIWNPDFGLATDFEFLNFAPKEKRFSYAASFGVSSLNMINEKDKNRIRKRLLEMKAISVREQAGKNIVKELIGAECCVHVDPTILLDVTEWDELLYPPTLPMPNKYILVYMLGEITTEYWDKIVTKAEECDAKIINILDEKYKTLDPIEFVWLIKNALCICTDSFHATVFSILYHKEFYVMNREDSFANQNSRFDTLFEKTGVNAKVLREKDLLGETDIDWDVVEQNLMRERETSYSFLKTILRDAI